MVSVKILLLAVVFVLTGGSIFMEYFRRHRSLLVLAAVVAVTSTYYLGKSIYIDLVEDVLSGMDTPDAIAPETPKPVDARNSITEAQGDPEPTQVANSESEKAVGQTEVSLSAWEQFARGNEIELDRGQGLTWKNIEAAEWYYLAANQGLAEAQVMLGSLYLEGDGVPRSVDEAVKFFRLAANQGNGYGQSNLGEMYRSGLGVPQSDTEAVRWFRVSAGQGNPSGQSNLGEMYRDGRGVSKSYLAAFRWFHRSAKQGDSSGQSNLGEMYRDGRGVRQSDAEAGKWFRLSAYQDNEAGRSNLREMYLDDRVVPQNQDDYDFLQGLLKE
ncbi:MAG: tetratricopeptide repeat protein [Paracoccaceae bacterium]|nr:tetratricopeptide repeat protein [Paracoccaceae bacterium]